MRVYDEPIAVKFDSEPRQFIWRHKLLLVKQVHARWSRTGAWWHELPEDPTASLLVERETWRVEAGDARHSGIYDVTRTIGREDWRLATVVD